MDHYPSLEFLGTYIWELNPCVFSLDCDKNEQNGAEATLWAAWWTDNCWDGCYHMHAIVVFCDIPITSTLEMIACRLIIAFMG